MTKGIVLMVTCAVVGIFAIVMIVMVIVHFLSILQKN